MQSHAASVRPFHVALIPALLLAASAAQAQHSGAGAIRIRGVLVPENPAAIATTGFSVEAANRLRFDGPAEFEALMATLVDQDPRDIDTWEATIGFVSMRTDYELLKLSPGVDALALDDTRIADPAFESVVNPNGEIAIGGTLYVYDFLADTVTVHEGGGATVASLGNDGTTGVCNMFFRSCERVNYLPFQTLTRGRKWNLNFGVYASIGASTRIYSWHPVTRKYESQVVGQVNLLLDQWHVIEYGVCPFANKTLTNKVAIASETDQVTRHFVWAPSVPLFAVKLRIKEFGRIHHWWGPLWLEDCHTETYAP